MSTLDGETLKAVVRETYGQIASAARSGGCCDGEGCCGASAGSGSDAIGYSDEERQSVPEGADLGLGCGNPQTIASLKENERVLDLGSGAGKTDLGNVEFRMGEIEHLPVADASVDVIMSNCVINLSTDKPAVFREAFRVLAPGGRLALADIVALDDMSEPTGDSLPAYAGCVSGAALVPVVEKMIRGAGFNDVVIELKDGGRRLDDARSTTVAPVAPALIRARKPLQDRR